MKRHRRIDVEQSIKRHLVEWGNSCLQDVFLYLWIIKRGSIVLLEIH